MINTIFKPKGSRIWRWKFRQRPLDGKILDVSLGTSDKQVAEKKRVEMLHEKEHECAGLIPSKAVRDAAQRKTADHLTDFIGDLRAKRLNGRYIKGVEYCLGQLCYVANALHRYESAKVNCPYTHHSIINCSRPLARAF